MLVNKWMCFHTLILKAFCVLDPMFNSGVVSCGLLMITIVLCTLLFDRSIPCVQVFFLVMQRLCDFFPNNSLCVFCSYLKRFLKTLVHVHILKCQAHA
jgi:hypothetical protein